MVLILKYELLGHYKIDLLVIKNLIYLHANAYPPNGDLLMLRSLSRVMFGSSKKGNTAELRF